MTTVLLVIHLMIAVALVGVVLVQRSEGGALGIGGGGSFMTGRGTANLLTRITAGLAVGFFVTSMALSMLASNGRRPASMLDQLNGQGSSTSLPAAGSGTTGGDSSSGGGTGEPTSVPQSQ
jgi:preprotein translocase subunit SecG